MDHLLMIKQLVLPMCLLLPARKLILNTLSIDKRFLVLVRSAVQVSELHSTCVVTPRVTIGSTKLASKPYRNPPFSFNTHPIMVFMIIKLGIDPCEFCSTVAPYPVLPFSGLSHALD